MITGVPSVGGFIDLIGNTKIASKYDKKLWRNETIKFTLPNETASKKPLKMYDKYKELHKHNTIADKKLRALLGDTIENYTDVIRVEFECKTKNELKDIFVDLPKKLKGETSEKLIADKNNIPLHVIMNSNKTPLTDNLHRVFDGCVPPLINSDKRFSTKDIALFETYIGSGENNKSIRTRIGKEIYKNKVYAKKFYDLFLEYKIAKNDLVSTNAITQLISIIEADEKE
jgi:hypothetical protein